MELDLSKVKTKQQFMDWFYENFNFPDYFGSNWDAVDECLMDFCKKDVAIKIIHAENMTEEVRKEYPMFKSVIDYFNQRGKIKISLLE